MVDAKTGVEYSPAEAIKRDVLDLQKGTYLNLETNESMSIQTAYDRGFIIAEQTDDLDGTATSTPDRPIRIRACLDTQKHEEVSVQESIARGILDPAITRYKNLQTGEYLSIQAAIDKGLIIIDDMVPPTSKRGVKGAQSYSIKSVIDPRSGEEIPIGDAVRHHIVDKTQGTYYNMATDEKISMEEAIKKGLVITEPIEVAGRTEAFLEYPGMPRTTMFKLVSIQDPMTGKWYDPIEAERRGLVNKLQGLYIQPITGKKISLVEAYRRGIIDPASGCFVDKLTGTKFTISDALSRGYVRAHMKRSDSSYIPWQPTKTLYVIGVIDPQTDTELTIEQAVSKGL